MTAGFQNSHVHFTEAKFADAATRPARRSSTAAIDGHAEPLRLHDRRRHGLQPRQHRRAARAHRDAAKSPGPRILTAGFALYPKNGIPIYLRDLPPDLLAMLSQPASVEEALADVQANLDGGADATKLFLMTPQGGGRYAFMQPDIALAAADETHRRGLPVLAHPTDIEGINLAIEAGVDVLVHTTIGEGKTVVGCAAHRADASRRTWRSSRRCMLFPYETEAREAAGTRRGRARPAMRWSRCAPIAKAGGQVLFGTDVGYMTDYDPTEEYRLMARALAPMEILASLTTAPAARWKEDEARGRVGAGLDADLVVLDADPAADAANFAKVRCTIRAGRLTYPPVVPR